MSIRTWAPRAVVCTLLSVALVAHSARAQYYDGSAAQRMAGGALGLMAGGMAGNVGSILPCTQTSLGSRCVGGATLLGGAVGLGSGIVLGGSAPGLVTDRATTALVGFAVGSTIGLAGRLSFERVGLADVLTMGVIGGAIGTQPGPALVGVAIGTALGVVLWTTVPGFEAPDIAAASVAGVMIGVLAAWVDDAVDARGSEQVSVPLLTIRWVP